MKLASSKLPLALFLLALTIYSVSSQCCLQFRNNQCVQCPAAMHLYRGNCIFDLPNCETYIDGFVCAKCKSGFIFNNQNQCVQQQIVITSSQVPKTGNSVVTSSNYQNDPYYLAAFNDAKSRLSADLGSSFSVSRVYFSQRTGQIWSVRIIFQISNGYLDSLYAFSSRSLTLTPTLISKRSFVLFSGEKFINFETDPNFNAIRNQISNQNTYDFLAAAKDSSLNAIDKYRIFYVDPNGGIVEVIIEIQKPTITTTTTQNSSNSKTFNGEEVFDNSVLSNIPQFAVGYQIFKDRPEVRGAQVIKLSRRLQNDVYTYIIRFFNRQTGRIFEGSYYIDLQKDQVQLVGFDQVTNSSGSSTQVTGNTDRPTNEVIRGSFAGVKLSQFRADSEASKAENFLRNIRRINLIGYNLDIVRLAVSSTHFFYELTFYSPSQRRYFVATVRQNINNRGNLQLVNEKQMPAVTGSLTKAQYENDVWFRNIQNFLLSKFSNQILNKSIKRVNLSRNGSKLIYNIVYASSSTSELFFSVSYNLENHLIQIIQSNQNNIPGATVVFSNNSTSTNTFENAKPVALLRSEWQRDAGFIASNQQILIANPTELRNAQVQLVSRIQSQLFNAYVIVYRYGVNNSQRAIFTAIYNRSTKTVTVAPEVQRSAVSPNPPTIDLPDSPKVQLAAQQYLNDANFQRVRTLLQQNSNLSRFNLSSVTREIKGGVIRYIVTYQNPIEIIVYETIYDPKTNIAKIEATAQSSKQPVPVPVPSAPRTQLNQQQYQNDSNLQKVRTFLESNRNLSSYRIVSVFREIKNGVYLYSITYQNPLELIIYETSLDPSTGNVKIDATALGRPIVQPPIKPVQPVRPVLPSSPRVQLTPQQYLNDSNFQKVRAFLGSNKDLSGYNITSVYRQIKNGIASYSVTFQNRFELILYETIFDPSTEKVSIQATALGSPAFQPISPIIAPNTNGNLLKTILSQQQIQSDKGFTKVDQYLRTQRDLSQHRLLNVLFAIENGIWVYEVSYQKGNEQVLMIANYNPRTDKVQLLATALNSAQQTPISVPTKPVVNPVPQGSSYKLQPGQTEVSTSQFTTNFPNEASYVVSLNSDLFASASLERIIYNQGAGYWKFFLSSGLYFTLVLEKGIFAISEIVPLNSQTIISSFSSSERAQIDKVAKLNSAVTSVSGSSYPINNGVVTYYRLIITLQNNQKYEVELLGEGSARANFRLLSYRMSNQQTIPSFNFGTATTQIPASVQNFINNNFNSRSIDFVQVDSNVPTIYRVIFTTSWGKAQLVYNSNQNILYSYDLVSAGFNTLANVPTSSIYKNAENLVASYAKLNNYRIAAVKERTWTGVTEYAIFFQTPSGTYKAIIMYNSANQKYYFNVFASKQSGIGKQQKIPSIFSNSQIVDTNQALNSQEFNAAQNLLISQYSHHLAQPQIQSIYTKIEGQNTVVYEVIYNTLQGTFLAILNFNRQTKTPSIKSLVLIDIGKLGLIIPGCQTPDDNRLNCIKCADGFRLGQDKFCYKNIDNCAFASGNLCLACSGNNLLVANQCTSQCGPYCRPNVYPYLGSPFDFKCTSFNDNTGKCASCVNGFTVDKNFGTCISNA